MPLVAQATVEVPSGFEPVFVTMDEFKLSLVKGFLQSLGIPFITAGDPAEPFGFAEPGEVARQMEIMVPQEHARRARMEIAKRERNGGAA